jgi:hypothetical protein
MKFTSHVLSLLLSLRLTFADDSSFQHEINTIRAHYIALENRKSMGKTLSASEEKERQCLLGQRTDEDPVTAVYRQTVAEWQALGGSSKAEDRALVEKLLSLVQITLHFQGRATTLPEAKSFATILSQFVARRDVEGARAWAKTYETPNQTMQPTASPRTASLFHD